VFDVTSWFGNVVLIGDLSMNVRTIAQTIRASACICLTVLLLCMGLVMGNIQPAFASNEAADAGQNQVEKGLDKVAGAGVAKQVEGRAKADAGRVQRQVGQIADDTSSQIEGAAKQIQGRATKDIGQTQSAAENAADDLEDAAGGLLNSVKNLFD
jgi:uncharacterized protein YjbJ (UPF0337 family)